MKEYHGKTCAVYTGRDLARNQFVEELKTVLIVVWISVIQIVAQFAAIIRYRFTSVFAALCLNMPSGVVSKSSMYKGFPRIRL